MSQNEIAAAADGRLDTPPVLAAKAREVWISGVATPRARQELEARGFKVVEKRNRHSGGEAK